MISKKALNIGRCKTCGKALMFLGCNNPKCDNNYKKVLKK